MGKEEYEKLLNDPEFQKGETIYTNLERALDNVLTARKVTIRNLIKLKEEVESSYDMSRKSIIGGTAGTVVGSALAITGFGLSFATLGASLVLTIAGTALSAAGGITAAGANIGYLAVSASCLKHAKIAVDTDQEMLEEAKSLNDQLLRIIDCLAIRYPAVPKEDIRKMLRDSAHLGKACAKVMWCSYKIVDTGFDIGKTVITATGRSTSAAARTTVWAGLSTAKQAFSVVGVVLDVVTIPVDLFVMIKASIDVHKFKTTGESNSDVAKKIGGFIKQLEEHRDELIARCGRE